MASFRAVEKELGKAFLRNLEASKSAAGAGNAEAALLLLFYAVECGLKHLLCVRRRGTHLEASDPLYWTHDLNGIAKELRLPTQPLPITFKLSARSGESGAGCDCHLAWRYGVQIDSADEQVIARGLTTVAERVSQDIY